MTTEERFEEAFHIDNMDEFDDFEDAEDYMEEYADEWKELLIKKQ